MSNIGTIALFVGVAIAGVIVWEIRRAPRFELRLRSLNLSIGNNHCSR